METILLFICGLIIGCFIGMGMGISFVVAREDNPTAVLEEMIDILLERFKHIWKKNSQER